SPSTYIFRVNANGAVFSDTAAAVGADYAEYFYTNSAGLLPGETVCVDVLVSNAVKRCDRGADNNVMGIVSTKPSFLGNNLTAAQSDPSHYAVIGMLGQVDAYASAENGPINVGDSLTSASSTPGYAMRADGGASTVGIALESLSSGTGKIKVLISRRNQSLAVEQVESLVADRIAGMKIEDSVNQMVAQSINSLTLLPQLSIAGVVSASSYEVPLSPTMATLFTSTNGTATTSTLENILASDGNVDLYKLATYTLTDLQAVRSDVSALTIRVDSLEARLARLENAASTSEAVGTTTAMVVATSTASSTFGESVAAMSTGLVSDLTSALSSLGSGLHTALAATFGVFDKVFAREVHTDNLCVGSVCVTQEQFLKMVQASGATTTPAVVPPTPPSSSGSGTPTPPPSDTGVSTSPTDTGTSTPVVTPPTDSGSSTPSTDTAVLPPADSTPPADTASTTP
ncbi:MAG: hypothetical protein RLZZ26_156, partial [Candidatus Parcubacteria bacterium]